MDFYRLIAQLFIISCVPLIYYALSKNLNLKEIKKSRWQLVIVFSLMSLLVIAGSNDGDESFFAIVISLGVYVFTYKRLVKNKYEPKISDFNSLDDYVSALAKKRNIKYPLSQNVIVVHGRVPEFENFESIPDWVKAVKQHLDDIESI